MRNQSFSLARLFLCLALVTGGGLGLAQSAAAQSEKPSKSVHQDLLKGVGCLSKIIPSGGTIVEKTAQVLSETGETTSVLITDVGGTSEQVEIEMEDVKTGEPVLPDETIGFNIGTDLGACTVLGSLVKGPQTDLFRAIIGFEQKLLNEFEKSLQFYLDQPRPIKEKTLKGCGFHYDQKVCLSLDVGVFEDGSRDKADAWIRLSNPSAVPDSLERRSLGAKINTEILLRFGELTLSSTEILFKDLNDTGQLSLRQIRSPQYQKISSYLRNDQVSAEVIIRDPSAIDYLTGSDGLQSGTVRLTSGGAAFPPSPPTVSVASNQNNINVSLGSSDAQEFRIFRSTESGFTLDEADPIAVIEGTSYTDDKNLVAGRNYYYKAVAVSSSGQVSNPSGEVSGQLKTNYQFEGLSEEERSRAAYSLDTFSGRLETLEGEPVPDADVSLSIPKIELTLDNVQTDENGEFSFQYRVPGETGTYTLRLRARADEGSRIRNLPLSVQKRPSWGRDLALSTLNVLDSLIVNGGEGAFKIGSSITNPGETKEEAEARYELQDRSGAIEESVPPEEFPLKAGDLRSLDKDLSVSSGLEPGSYQLRASVESQAGLDRERSNNTATLEAYVLSKRYSAPTYRSTEYQITDDGSSKTIDGKAVSVVSLSSTSVTFAVDGEETEALPIGGEPKPPWTSSAKDFLILKEEISVQNDVPSDPDTVFFRAGGVASEASVSPDRMHEKRGRTEAFEVKVPEGQTLEPSAVTFPYGSDSDALSNWESSAEDESPSPRTVTLGVEVGSSAELRDYAGWLEWEGSSQSFHKRVKVRPRPIHDLALVNYDVQGTIDGGNQDIPDFIPGAPVEISGTVENRGDFRETDSVEVKVKIDGDGDTEEKVVYTEDVTADLAPRENPDQTSGETQDFSFTWPTVGLPTGSYTVSVEAAHSVDETPADNRKEESITLEKPPKVDVQAKMSEGPFEVGEEIPIRAFVGREDQPFSEASVSATLIGPTGKEEGINLKYNSTSQLFETTVFANHGGNYRVEVQAERAPYRPGGDTALIAKTYVDVSASLSSSTVDVGRTRTLRLETSNVGGLYGVSADVIYDEDQLEYVRAAESAFLSEGETVQTTLQAEDRGGRVVTGVTRLDPEKGGVTSTRGGRLLSLGFAGEATGSQTFALENVDLLDREGEPMETRTVSSSPELTVEEEPAAVSVSLRDTVSTAAGRDTAQVTLTNAYRTETFGGTISFDPSSMRVIDVVEGPTLSERGEAKTLFARDIDQAEGTAQFSITRTGDQPGVSVGSAPVAQLVYEPKASGESPVVVEQENVVTGREGISLPTFSQNDTLVVAGDDSSGSGRESEISIAPDTVEVGQGVTASVAVTAEDVSDVYSFAGDLAYDSSELTFADIEEGDFLSADGRVRTSLTHQVREDTVVVGMSRLDEGAGGAETSEKDTLFTVEFLRSGTAQSEVNLTNVGILRPNTSTIDVPVDSSLMVAESSPDTTSGTILSFSPSGQTPAVGKTFSHAVTVENVTDLFSLATTVAFDPDLVNFVDIQEGDFLSENGDVSTSFTRDVDQSAGTIVTGLSRLGADIGGVSTEEPDTLFTLRFERTGEAQSQIELTNTGLLRPDGETEIPFKTEPARVNTPPTATRPVPPDTFKVPSPPVQLTNLGGTIFSDPGGDELAFSASSNAPSIVEATGTFSKTVMLEPQETGTAEVTVKASDGLSETDTSFSVTVEERAPSEAVPTSRGTAIVEASNGDTAQVEFGGTGASATFQNLQSGGAADASFFDGEDDSPGTSSPFVPDDPFESVSPYRWKVSGNGVSSKSVSLTLALGESAVEGVQAPQDVMIIRDGEGDGTFKPVETTYDDGGTPMDPSDDVLIARGLSGFSTFRLASNNPSNSLGSSLDRPDRIGFDVSRDFGGASGPADYRLVALPGQIERSLGESVSGEAGSEWQAFWDTGDTEDYFARYDGSDTFDFRPGRGFWLTSRQQWTISDSVEVVPLGSDQATKIPLHEGWNIISNPLREDTPWSAVQDNHSESLQPAWRFEGSFQQSDTLRSAATGQAYYFLNDQGLDSLTVPYPTSAKSDGRGTLATEARPEGTGGAEENAITLVAERGEALQSKVQVGIDSEAASGLGPRDVVAPPARFSAISLRLVPSGSAPPGSVPPRKRRLAAEWRPPASELDDRRDGHTFSLRLRAESSAPVDLRANGPRSLKGRHVALLRPSTGQSWDLRSKKTVTVQEVDSTALKLAVGSATYVDKQEQEVVPDEVTLTSYPNPMRQQATLEYTLTEPTDVRITVHDVLGRRVAVLEDRRRKTGRYRVQLDGGDLASGVYFGRLKTKNQTRTQKITVVR